MECKGPELKLAVSAQLTQAKDSQIEAGSALCRVNGESVVLKDYAAITAMLSGWQPPLTLGFRRSPSMSGKVKRDSGIIVEAAFLVAIKRRVISVG